MSGWQPRVLRHAGDYASAVGLLPGAVVSAVGYDSSGLVPQLHRGLPSPYLTVIFSLGQPIVSGTGPAEAVGPGADRNTVLVAGLHEAPTYVVQPTEQSGIQLAVHPLAARAILGAPASRLPSQVVAGADLLGSGADRIREQLVEQSSWEERFATMARYLNRQLATHASLGRRRPELAEGWRWLATRHGSGSIEELARSVALSPRQLRTVFEAELGIGPKRVAQLMRFDRARQAMAAASAGGGRVVLTDLAHRCGYFDHPHLDNEFRRFAGISPSAWLAEERRNIQAGGHVRPTESLT